MEWTVYRFAPFGLSCDVPARGQMAVQLDGRKPQGGYLATSAGTASLFVMHGPDQSLDAWEARLRSRPTVRVEVVEQQAPTTLGARPAQRRTLRVSEENAPVGTVVRPDSSIAHVTGGYPQAMLRTAVATDPSTPLLAEVQAPEAAWPSRDAAHFFASFRYED